MNPKEALQIIRDAAEADNIEFASDTLTTQLDAEMQEIYSELYYQMRGKLPKRALWVADGYGIEVILDGKWDEKSLKAIDYVNKKFNLDLIPQTKWEDAALKLRAQRYTPKQ